MKEDLIAQMKLLLKREQLGLPLDPASLRNLADIAIDVARTEERQTRPRTFPSVLAATGRIL